jgi:tetratricopeptide (TPR) repeat protein
VEQIAARLDDQFNLLTGGSRTLQRHQTLRALIDWSHNLLTEQERALLRRLSVFPGGWTLEGAEAVCSDDASQGLILSHAMMDVLDGLVNKSLVVVNPGSPETRYHMLETIRQYARERLVDSSQEGHVRARHLAYFLGIAQSGEIDVVGREDPAYFKMLETELDNLRAALEWSLTRYTDSEDALRLASALRFLWYISYQMEGVKWLTAALDKNEEASAASKAKALNGMALIASFQGNYSQMKTFCKSSAAIAQEANDKHEMALALELLGVATAMEGDLEDGILLLRQTRRLAQEQDDKWMQGFHCVDLGYALMRKGDYSDADTIFNDGLRVSHEIGMKINEAYCLTYLASLAMRGGDFQQAREKLQKSTRIFVNVGDRFGPMMCLIYFAELAKPDSKLKIAATLFGAVAAICKASGIRLFFMERAITDRSVAELRTQLLETSFNTAWAEGEAMTLEQAVAYAL